MKISRRAIIAVVALIVVSFMVPEYDDRPRTWDEDVVDIRVASSGDTIVLRTKPYDYAFALPANKLAEALGSSKPQSLDTSQTGEGKFSNIHIDQQGKATARFTAAFGGYDARKPGMTSVLSAATRERLGKLGFTPIGRGSDDTEPALFMKWERELTGQRLAASDPESTIGIQVDDGSYESVERVEVTQDDPALLSRHRALNTVFAPIHALRDGVRFLLNIPGTILYMMGGLEPSLDPAAWEHPRERVAGLALPRSSMLVIGALHTVPICCTAF